MIVRAASCLVLALVALCAGFYLWHYDALQNYLGWPAANALPRQFEMISSLIVDAGDLIQNKTRRILVARLHHSARCKSHSS